MEAEAATAGRRPGWKRGPVLAWSIIAAVQVAFGAIAWSSRDEADDANPLFDGTFVVSSLVVYSILIGLTLGIAAGYSLDLRRALGFRPFAPRWLAVGVGVILLAIAVGAVMSAFGDPAEEQGLAPDRWEPGKGGIFALAALVVVLFVPFAEELFFRGLGVGVLSFAGPAVAVAVPGITFALAHGIPLAIPTLLVLGGGLAWIRYQSGSIWPCFLAHAAWNGIALAVAAATSF
jgi:uncharacterized protein